MVKFYTDVSETVKNGSPVLYYLSIILFMMVDKQ